jgi:serine/threonine-protein kinase
VLFSFHCPACKSKLEADASLSGSQADCPHCAAPVAIPEGRVAAGTTLAGFRLDRRLGKGGMGEVYLAQQLSVRRQVAVKILPPGFAENPEAIQRFMHEGRLAAKLDHFNIVTVFEAGEDNGHFYLAMAYIEGESLDQRLKRDKVLPEAEALGIIRTMADALAYAWDEFQLLHRDLKPANIMVDRRGRVFLMDLGLAKSLGEENGMTLSGAVIGTPQYMSPEQAQGLSDLGVPTDVYALGATLYHLVTGTPPFSGDSALGMLNQHVHAPLPPPRSRNPQVSEACSQLIETMMAKQPAARYGDWHALVADIDRVRQGAVPAVAPSVVPSSGGPISAQAPGVAAAPPDVSQADPLRPPQEASLGLRRAPPSSVTPVVPIATRRPSWLTLGLAAAVLVVLALISVLVVSRRGRPAASPSEAAAAALPTPKPAPALAPAPTVPPVVASAGPVAGQPWTVPEVGMEFVWIKPMNLWVGKYEMTNGEYRKKEPGHDSKTYDGLDLNGDRQPVVVVGWGDACAYAEWLTERERAAGRLPTGLRYRLPTEDEFMVYAQCGDGREYPWGNEWPPKSGQAGNYSGEESAWKGRLAGYLDGHPATCVVEKSWANPWGLYGVGGNVWEGCASDTNPKPTFGGWRGACWAASPQELLRCACRFPYGNASSKSPFTGFRLVLSPGPAATTATTAAPPVLGQPWTVPALGLELVWVAPGSFQMGAADAADCEKPVHTVRISQGFWMGTYQVTQAEYEAVIGKNLSRFKGARNPVEQVSWNDATAFCAKLTEREQKSGRLPAGHEYRLPTEAEWEYAARGGAGSKGYTYAGSNVVDEVAWYYGNSGDRPLDDAEADGNKRESNAISNKCRTHPVGQKKPNELGLYDLSGNVWEWCLDWYDDTYYAKSPGTDPVNLRATTLRACRGGGWIYGAGSVRLASREKDKPTDRFHFTGFRACLAPPLPAAP